MEWEKELRKAFEDAMWRIPARVGIVFSGGLDSSLLAYLINMHDKDVHLYSAAVKGSHDSKWVGKAANLLGLPIKTIEPGEDEIVEAISDIKKIDPRADPLSIVIDLPHYFTSKYSENRILVSGQGSDELFLGYKKYEKSNTSSQDLDKLINVDSERERKIAGRWNRRLIFPYLDEIVVRTAKMVPDDLKLHNGTHKYILRKMAESIGLTPEIALKPKKSAQYSSGFKSILEEIAEKNGKRIYEFIRDL
ncbi:MAG: asparagine synthase-related protein [Candidatus Thermoplasmatota archaeon]|jgi:asparagine synthase (glutamine-hydrolysing)|nr:asparagine synthase-related protein [Candidatus Thermoplasmatota archaeon]